MRRQTLNTLTAVLQNVVAILCGLILPRVILTHYGSEMNGLTHSVAQFLSYLGLFEFGIGAVIPAALYEPLVKRDSKTISAILASGAKVFRRIALAGVVYILILMAVFPALTGSAFETSALFLLIIGAGTVAGYIAGEPERLLLISDQKGCLISGLAAISTLLSTLVQLALIRSGRSLAAAKLSATVIGILQILLICLYVRRHYSIDRKIRYEREPIPQKWNGTAQHVAFFVLENTDIILLSVFTTFREVSVYSVYFMFISGVRRILMSISYSVQPKLGELQARGDREALRSFFASFERWIHLSSVLAFGCLGVFLVPFVRVYTEGVQDADYIRPLFALLMTLAYGIQSVRDPYDKLILASGHFKQTQHNYIIAACLNLGVSLLAVQRWGLEGVAAGTLLAMAYQLVYMAVYDTKVLLKRPFRVLIRQILIDLALIGVIVLAGDLVREPGEAFFRWIMGLFHG